MADKDQEGKKKKSPMLLFGLIGLVVIVLIAFVVCFVILPPPTSGDNLDGEPKKKDGPMKPESWQKSTLKIENLLVNLAGTSGRRYLKMSLAIEYKAPDPLAVEALAQEKMIELRDGLITLLSGKTLESLDGMDNKNQLKLEIIETLGPILFSEDEDRKGRIEWVYYDEFLTQ